MAQEKKSAKKLFKWIPDDFMKDVYIEPHNFIWPENPEHGEYVNQQLKCDLFYDAYNKIEEVEGKYLKEDNDYFKLKSVKPLEKTPFYDQLFMYFIKDQKLSTEEWTMDLNGKSESYYIVHALQSENDRFYTKVVPRHFTRLFQMAWNSYNIFN